MHTQQQVEVRALISAFSDISRFCTLSRLPRATEALARRIYRQFHFSEDRASRLLTSNQAAYASASIITATLYISPILTIVEATTFSGEPADAIIEAIFVIDRTANFCVPANSVVSLAAKYCTDLCLDAKFTAMVEELVANVHDSRCLLAHQPEAVAGCCLLMVGHMVNGRSSVGEIAKAAGIMDDALVSAYETLLPGRVRVLNPEWLEAGDPWVEFGEERDCRDRMPWRP
jgi:transcription initiation factor TFIIIB Brf1 subunit/transcription initiation factor TFIIB